MYPEAAYMTEGNGACNVRAKSSNVRAASSNDVYKSLISLPAAISLYVALRRPAMSSKMQCFKRCSVQQHPSRNMHPYGGRAGETPPGGSGLSPRGFGVAGKAELKARQAGPSRMAGIPYRSMSAGRL